MPGPSTLKVVLLTDCPDVEASLSAAVSKVSEIEVGFEVWSAPLAVIPEGEWPVLFLAMRDPAKALVQLQVIRNARVCSGTRISLLLDDPVRCPPEAVLRLYDVSDVRASADIHPKSLCHWIRNALQQYRDQRERKVIDEILGLGRLATGTDYVKLIVQNLARKLGYKYAFVGRVLSPPRERTVRTVSLWSGDHFAENFEYQLDETPCDQVLSGRRVCVYPISVHRTFPNDHELKEMGVVSYIGCPILNADGSLLGLLACLDTKPMTRVEEHKPIIEFFASRAGVELERQDSMDGLRKLNEILEERVAKRTEELEQTHKVMVEIAHRAGMAEIATGVLHNIGNLLNSVRVSSDLIKIAVDDSHLPLIHRINEMIETHKGDLGSFLDRDTKGTLVTECLAQLELALSKKFDLLGHESGIILSHTKTISQVIQTQQAYAEGPAFLESADLNDLVRITLELMIGSLDRHRVKVICHFGDEIPVTVQKAKMIQVLGNLLQNAKEAVLALDKEHRKIVISTFTARSGRAGLSVKDNGVGFTAPERERLFKFGFTTKETGHGFGLHSSHIFLKDMDGTLTAESAGKGKGAVFTLTLPMARNGRIESAP